jgi:putative copper export protein
MPRLALLVAVVRGLELVGVAVVIGGLVLDGLVFPAGEAALADARRRLRRAITAGLSVLLLVSLAALLVRTESMSGASVTPAALGEVLTRTHFGTIWTIRGVALALALGLSLARAPALRGLCLLIAVGVALTISLTGHAAEWGDLTVSVAADWTHAVAASVWTGGLLGLSLVARRPDPPWPPPVLGAVARRFSRLAGLCLLAVMLTGVYNAWAQLGAVSALLSTTYGRVLGLKLIVVVGLVGLGAVNRYVVVPRLDPRAVSGVGARVARLSRLVLRGGPGLTRGRAPARFSTYLVAEALLALGVFVCTAALGAATPGRHALLQRKLSTHVSAKDLRQSRDADRGGSVMPPAGDRARGRAVFVKLQCFSCHRVQPEPFPAPARPGPDLTSAGRHHPGYLLESVINPSAMVVDGPGYADERGRSIMPDYREQLTLSELIDLVAYLKSLDAAR